MNTSIVPELRSKIEITAGKLAESSEDSLVIEGVDNKTLVKDNTDLAAKMRADGMLLFPVQIGEKDYLVCITTAR